MRVFPVLYMEAEESPKRFPFGANSDKGRTQCLTWFKHILLVRTVNIIKHMLTMLKFQGLEWKQHAYRLQITYCT